MKTDLRDAEQYIYNLIQSGESQYLDFKFEISNSKKIARTFSAFANTNGGKLLIGVKDNGRISGIRSEEEAYMVESAAHLFCKPAVTYQIHKWWIKGRCVLEVDIPLSTKRPHYARDDDDKWMAFVRVNDQNIKANSVLVSVWKQKGKKGVFIHYGRPEKYLLDYLVNNESITLSRFVKIARINRSEAEKVLVNLILMHVIDMKITEKTVSYYMRKTG
jgi:predicted HTH transcriptional regulator